MRRPAALAVSVPILLLHHIGAPPAYDQHPSLWVRPAQLRRDVDALARAGYHAVTLERVWRSWHGGAPLPPRPLVLSFDDGYAAQQTAAAPILRARGWSGVLFLSQRWLDAPDGISAAQVRALLADGWELDAHSLTHPDLRRVSRARLRREVAGSRRAVQRGFGVPARFFAYPYGRSNPAVRAEVRRAGFAGAVTIRPGLATRARPLLMDRIVLDGRRSAAWLLRTLRRQGRP